MDFTRTFIVCLSSMKTLMKKKRKKRPRRFFMGKLNGRNKDTDVLWCVGLELFPFLCPLQINFTKKNTDKQNQPKMIPLQKFFINPPVAIPQVIRRVPFFRLFPMEICFPSCLNPSTPAPHWKPRMWWQTVQKAKRLDPFVLREKILSLNASEAGSHDISLSSPPLGPESYDFVKRLGFFFGYVGLEKSGKHNMLKLLYLHLSLRKQRVEVEAKVTLLVQVVSNSGTCNIWNMWVL